MTPGEIVSQAQDALESGAMHGGSLPQAIEDGATPPADLSEFQSPAMVVVIRSPRRSRGPRPTDPGSRPW